MSNLEIENKIRIERARQKMTQKQLAKKVGVSRQSIHAIESGKTEPSLRSAMNISEVLDIKITKLFKFKKK